MQEQSDSNSRQPPQIEKIEWNSGYSVGHPLMDRQHQKLVGLVNEMVECVNEWGEGISRSRLLRLLADFYSTSEDHFSREEMLLSRVDYPQLQEQQRSHESYAEKFSWFIAHNNKSDAYRRDFVKLLRSWWENHILVEDMAYKSYFEQSAEEKNGD